MRALRLLVGAMAAVTGLVLVTPDAGAAAKGQPVCGSGQNIEPFTGICAKVARQADGAEAAAESRQLPPDLATLRAERQARLSGATGAKALTPPVPGGDGGGIWYRDHKLQALRQCELYTRVIVQPNGLGPTVDGLDQMFTTATNRVDAGVEVAIWYPHVPIPNWAALHVFDWSCSASDPCSSGQTQPAWVKSFALPDASSACYLDLQASAGHVHRLLYYGNVSRKLHNANPPLWQNQVLIWNYCMKGWDLFYEHQYRFQQEDCANTLTCGGWGPILETFDNGSGKPFPPIREVGYERSKLVHDGVTSNLPTSETSFTPLASPWKLYHLDANRGFGAGNRFRKQVKLDVVPGKTSPCVLPGSSKEVKAALLSATGFKPGSLDRASLKIGRNGIAPTRTELARVNGDSEKDLVFYFRPNQTGLVVGDTKLGVTARTPAAAEFGGVDTVRTSGCG